jgi:hypothetical protein
MKLLTFIAVLTLTVLSGLIQGRMMNRWGAPAEFLAVGRKLEQFPTRFGDWELLKRDEFDESSRQQLEPYGHVGGGYKHQTSGAIVTMFVIVGPTGTIAVHTPEVCFGSREYQKIEARKPFAVSKASSPGQSDTFWRVMFKRTDVNGNLVPTYYGWTIGDRWIASPDPRYAFAGNPYLYKVQVTCALPLGLTSPDTDPCQDFLADFVTAAAPYLVIPKERK